ncbi:GntP family permease, partial [candidate division KSB1 bacterium]|nr:GntP family permease [candidate division KSB1 bacterium]
IGYIVSIPVFGDSGFIILSPLNKALCKRSGISAAGPTIALSIGLTVSHNLVPPTPGPIAAAGYLEADLGLVLLLGIPMSIVVLFFTWLFAVFYAGKTHIDPNPELDQDDVNRRLEKAPSALKSILPIFVPILLLVMRSVALLPSLPFGTGQLKELLAFIGQPVIALLAGVLLALTLPKKFKLSFLSTDSWVGKAMLNAALIILVTGAGGSFGMVLQNSKIADTLGTMLSDANLGIWLPFIIAAAIKTAQGSSTVALITTASILAPILSPLGFDSEVARALVVLAIGSGAMVASHANDSFFWVVTQMSNMTVPTCYKLHTLGTVVAGTSAIFFTWILSLFVL